MKKIARLDLLAHLAIGFFLALALAQVLQAPIGLPLANAVAGLLVAALMWAKEKRYDKLRPATNTDDGWDAYAGVLGALLAQPLTPLLPS